MITQFFVVANEKSESILGCFTLLDFEEVEVSIELEAGDKKETLVYKDKVTFFCFNNKEKMDAIRNDILRVVGEWGVESTEDWDISDLNFEKFLVDKLLKTQVVA